MLTSLSLHLFTLFWQCGGQLLIWMPSIHFPLFSSKNNCIFLWENSPTQLHGGTGWAFMRLLPLQAVAVRSQLGLSNHLPTNGIMSRWTPGSKMLELTLPPTKESFCKFLLHRLPLSCFRPLPCKTWLFSFSFLFSIAFLCGLTWSVSAVVRHFKNPDWYRGGLWLVLSANQISWFCIQHDGFGSF